MREEPSVIEDISVNRILPRIYYNDKLVRLATTKQIIMNNIGRLIVPFLIIIKKEKRQHKRPLPNLIKF